MHPQFVLPVSNSCADVFSKEGGLLGVFVFLRNSMLFSGFLLDFLSFFVWFSYGFSVVFLWISWVFNCFSNVFQWFSNGFQWFSNGFQLVSNGFSPNSFVCKGSDGPVLGSSGPRTGVTANGFTRLFKNRLKTLRLSQKSTYCLFPSVRMTLFCASYAAPRSII